MVRTPISRRTGATFFIALVVGRVHEADAGGLDALGDLLPAWVEIDAERLRSRRPRPTSTTRRARRAWRRGARRAATNIEVVEMLKVWRRRRRCRRRRGSGRAAARPRPWSDISRITVAAAVISPMVSFLTRRPVRMAAVITGEISPAMIWRISVQHLVEGRFAVLDGALQGLGGNRGHGNFAASFRPPPAGWRGQSRKFFSIVAALGEDGLGMELHALDRRASCVAHAHDLAVPVGPRRDLQAVGQASRGDRQRMVARDRERVGQAANTPWSV